MKISDRLKQLRKKIKLNQTEFGERLGYKQTAVGHWETERRTIPDSAILAICREFNVNEEWLRNGTGEMFVSHPDDVIETLVQKYGLSDFDRVLVTQYSKLSVQQRKAVHAFLDEMYDELQEDGLNNVIEFPEEPELETKDLPTSHQSASAGSGVFLQDEHMYMLKVKASAIPKGDCFGVPVAGDSMEPRFHHEDILIVSPVPVNIGDIGVFTMNGEGFVKELGVGVLYSLNPDYEDIPMSGDIICNGKVVGVLDEKDILK